jgi:hypothetical protein
MKGDGFMDKKKSVPNSVVVAFIAGAFFAFILMGAIFAIQHSTDNKVSVAKDLLEENGFYPGRIQGDYSDIVFSFDAYLESIGAENVQRYIYQEDEGAKHELHFDLDGSNYTVETTVFKMDNCTFGLYSNLVIDTGRVIFAVPTNNSGTFVLDATSPFVMDGLIFDVLHCVTDKNSIVRKDLQSKVEESNCPFRGLGVAHYERWADGTLIWHDDLGEYMAGNTLVLHY